MLQHRLDQMLYVGLTEEHRKSATMFAKLVGAQVLSQSEALNSTFKQETSNQTGTPETWFFTFSHGVSQFSYLCLYALCFYGANHIC